MSPSSFPLIHVSLSFAFGMSLLSKSRQCTKGDDFFLADALTTCMFMFLKATYSEFTELNQVEKKCWASPLSRHMSCAESITGEQKLRLTERRRASTVAGVCTKAPSELCRLSLAVHVIEPSPYAII
jgi:hypothetical protein